MNTARARPRALQASRCACGRQQAGGEHLGWGLSASCLVPFRTLSPACVVEAGTSNRCLQGARSSMAFALLGHRMLHESGHRCDMNSGGRLAELG